MRHSKLLYYFSETAKAGTLSAAAKTIGITQPAVTRSLKQLEDILGVTLFDRRSTGVVLTPEGQILARRVKLMTLEYTHALAELADLNKGVSGRLRIGAGPVWLLSILPPVINEFHKQFPEVRISVTGPGFDASIQQLLNGDLDMICGGLDFPDHADIVKEPLLKLRHTVFGRKGHPLALKKNVNAEELNNYPWIVLADDRASGSTIGAYFAANSLEPPNVVVETSYLGALTIAGSTDYLSTFAESGLSEIEAFGLTQISHEGTFWEFEGGIARRRSSPPGPAFQGFRAILKSSVA
ncbi:MAG: LysR family transcriptional regulator [Rhodospirillaceae bacterium]|jgi:DNA-binding transcriptional LysR family regulator|nr:LysR family transcriptional regulator [Rhodospirillaceae bacterium]MBT5940689.1 LysR family transcriptional regulator [Rhodospirillaceae bacterium]MBT7266423.1 LysR family transcriptional regulator [Rhodospirillaceae bacterium]